MLAYQNKIYSFQKRYPNTLVWRMYDEEFRKLKVSNPSLEWHTTHQDALDGVLDSMATHRDFQSTKKDFQSPTGKDQKDR